LVIGKACRNRFSFAMRYRMYACQSWNIVGHAAWTSRQVSSINQRENPTVISRVVEHVKLITMQPIGIGTFRACRSAVDGRSPCWAVMHGITC